MTSRILGWCFVVAAVGALGGHFGTAGKSIAEVWARADANSLVGLQATVEQRLDPNPEEPTLYFDIVLPVLQLPLWLSLFVIFAVLAAASFASAWMRRERHRDSPFD